MEICHCETLDDLAAAGAEYIHRRAKQAIDQRGQFTLALSGGSTPWRMLSKLADCELAWQLVKVVQVDERVAPDDDPERNLAHIKKEFADRIPLPADNLYAMPVASDDLEKGAHQYQLALIGLAGESPILDVVHLGLGTDGHTASLIPGDPVLDAIESDVATTGIYNGRRRMTLTYPIINRARHIMWLIIGADKAEMLKRMLRADHAIPAGRISQRQATVFGDAAALSAQIES